MSLDYVTDNINKDMKYRTDNLCFPYWSASVYSENETKDNQFSINFKCSIAYMWNVKIQHYLAEKQFTIKSAMNLVAGEYNSSLFKTLNL